jgi:hypothetical protein
LIAVDGYVIPLEEDKTIVDAFNLLFQVYSIFNINYNEDICKEQHLNFESVSSHLQKEHHISKASNLNLKFVRSEQCLKSYCNLYSLKKHSNKCNVKKEFYFKF